MDRSFPLQRWEPTAVNLPDGRWAELHVPGLAADLVAATERLRSCPYEPKNWIVRGMILKDLHLPELAAGDAHKAIMLCRNAQLRSVDQPTWRLGHGKGFYICGDEGEEESEGRQRGETQVLEREMQEEDSLGLRLVEQLTEAHKIVAECVSFDQTAGEGMYYPRAYPWMEERHLGRSDDLIKEINEEFLVATSKVTEGMIGSYCRLQRHAFGSVDLPDKSSSEILGVFATRDIEPDIAILSDPTRVWGCNGQGREGDSSNLHRGAGCLDPIHPNRHNQDRARHDLRWIRDRAGKDAAEIITHCRMLTIAIDDGYTHPLDHPLIARLTATYRRGRPRLFSLNHDIAIPNDCLQQWGVDIFANPHFDTWVLFTVHARVRNNCWDGMIHNGVSPLFSLFNHSCDANVEWSTCLEDYTTIELTTARHIRKGEQLCVNYDEFALGKPLAERRERLRHWFDGDCVCRKCVGDEEMMMRRDTRSAGLTGVAHEGEWEAVGDWDDAPKPLFPEDSYNARRRDRREQA
ncbi:SET (Su(var)3-9, Enhancer-of-zeste, Trithorax) domain [Teratosphaeria destructans]|uniref:SET (Su(Var)3-9, Enhancer-of-zeste, Trithorax) domain n=1 Tax=Teratosphaeria destructans TaxID=418781 RepID=A0A9W7SNY5_9PEZI|nr:SET (Su(var)3-9, Enhancer-of-zeste, Trithorax) domain [Teratosphaeria destructans]